MLDEALPTPRDNSSRSYSNRGYGGHGGGGGGGVIRRSRGGRRGSYHPYKRVDGRGGGGVGRGSRLPLSLRGGGVKQLWKKHLGEFRDEDRKKIDSLPDKKVAIDVSAWMHMLDCR